MFNLISPTKPALARGSVPSGKRTDKEHLNFSTKLEPLSIGLANRLKNNKRPKYRTFVQISI
ncbi:MAG: hypothetical protein UV78_C0031G0004 [Parcubacteria group bacterium GW2011_GWA2_43_17]|nr:MAG: hypothetical protein UV78_C0031G0004 [Parcubacteria group bacterium GW2011_GWA2_43_17]KKT90777.1 MAG: hypothetical protein UW91_C0047G0002 [Parcubacteria group bacterium GW2011_GWF2_45_11]KKT98294.1 MAG: hypothetical protein UW98_C0008G0006 [Parcubacteria group bacterium GW2011_GWC2_45_15]